MAILDDLIGSKTLIVTYEFYIKLKIYNNVNIFSILSFDSYDLYSFFTRCYLKVRIHL
jgi:hypothetical protein